MTAIDGLKLCLASASPRRRILLEGAGASVEVKPADIDESVHDAEDPIQYALRMARTKARVCFERHPSVDRTIVAGDTVVVLNGEILPKPNDEVHAAQILSKLSGQKHSVVSAWATIDRHGDVKLGYDEARIQFRSLTEQDIGAYVSTGEPLDKAGAYGIQGLGGQLVQNYQGDFDTIVGLNVASILRDSRRRGQANTSDLGIRLACIRARIAVAADVAQRKASSVTIVGASKAQPSDILLDAYRHGLRHFGESYEQELRARQGLDMPSANWHFIGRLQRNKARRVVTHVNWVHTVDSPRLAEAIDRHARELGKQIRCLVQVNIGDESSKGGVSPDQCNELVQQIASSPGLEVCGLMALPPRAGFAELRHWFRRVRVLRDEISSSECPLPELSMGMSRDLDAAVVEGATLVRPGSSLFGTRQP